MVLEAASAVVTVGLRNVLIDLRLAHLEDALTHVSEVLEGDVGEERLRGRRRRLDISNPTSIERRVGGGGRGGGGGGRGRGGGGGVDLEEAKLVASLPIPTARGSGRGMRVRIGELGQIVRVVGIHASGL